MREKKSKMMLVPAFMLIPLFLEALWNAITYFGTRILTSGWHHINAESFLDSKIPFLPWTVSIYLGCYVFWAVNYIIASRQEKKEAFRFMSADFLAKTACLLCFLIIPTTNTRPAVESEGFWNQVMIHLYNTDAADNLFPSIHCLTSWFSYIAVRKNKRIPKPYAMFSLICAISICISTVTTKQHVLIDIIGGIGLAEGSYFIVQYGFAGLYERYVTKLNKILKLDW